MMEACRVISRIGVSVGIMGFVLVAGATASQAETIHKTLDGWNVYVTQSPTDAMQAYNATYNGTPIFVGGVKMPDIRADYPDSTSIVDQMYDWLPGDAGSGRALIDYQNVSGGFKFTRRYNFSSEYVYILSYTFRSNGNLEISVRILGPGAPFHQGAPRYFVFWRTDYDVNGGSGDNIGQWDGQWDPKTTETTMLDDGSHNAYGEEWRFHDNSRTNPVAPASNDTARFWALKYALGEGAGDIGGEADPGSYENQE